MNKQHGNPKFEIRVAQSRRETWQRAADLEKRSLSDFVRIATDEKTKQVLEPYFELKHGRNKMERMPQMQINVSDTDKQVLSRHTASGRGRAFIELQIVEALIKAASEAGYFYEIEGEGDTEDISTPENLKLVLFNLDDATLIVKDDKGLYRGWIRLVFGNDGYDLCK